MHFMLTYTNPSKCENLKTTVGVDKLFTFIRTYLEKNTSIKISFIHISFSSRRACWLTSLKVNRGFLSCSYETFDQDLTNYCINDFTVSYKFR